MNLVAFTICSNNYFAFAKVLAKSWIQHHPNSKFVIVLVDEENEHVDYKFHNDVDVWSLERLQLANLDELVCRYNITELNTAVKADAFLKIFEWYNAEKVLYIDPDIQVFSAFTEVEEALNTYNIVVTPHYCTPIDDGCSTTDFKMLGSGLFNLGFLGLSHLEKVKDFLYWWRERLYKYAYCDLANNLFYDQAWINYIVVFFDNYYVLKNPGYNVANWNFHERTIQENGEGYTVNEKYPLRFFHFSGYKLKNPEQFAFYHTRFTWNSRPDMARLYSQYRDLLLDNGSLQFSKIPCVYFERHKLLRQERELKEWNDTPIQIRLAKKAVRLARKILQNS
jgi:hypothetical protein